LIYVVTYRAGDKYRGEYHLDDATGQVTGCPARAYTIKQLVRLIRVRDKQKGAAATRHHAEAMKIEDLTTIIKWSDFMVPPENAAANSLSMAEAMPLKHFMMRAFLTSGFTLWTRYEYFKLYYNNLMA
jgi:hypothetical protein